MSARNPFDSPKDVNSDYDKQKYLSKMFTLLFSFAVLGLAVVDYLYIKNIFAARIEIALTLGVILCLLLFYLTKRFILFTNIMFAIMLGFVLFCSMRGDLYDTGFVWLFLFPLASFGTVGKTRGLMWTIIFYIALSIGYLLSVLKLIDNPFVGLKAVFILVPHIIFTFVIYLYEKNNEHYQKLAHITALELNNANDHLMREVTERKAAQVELARQLLTLETERGSTKQPQNQQQ